MSLSPCLLNCFHISSSKRKTGAFRSSGEISRYRGLNNWNCHGCNTSGTAIHRRTPFSLIYSAPCGFQNTLFRSILISTVSNLANIDSTDLSLYLITVSKRQPTAAKKPLAANQLNTIRPTLADISRQNRIYFRFTLIKIQFRLQSIEALNVKSIEKSTRV